MNWAMLIPLIAQYGIPLAEYLWQRWTSKAAPTQADWDELRALSQNTAASQMLAALHNAGIDPNSAAGQQFLGLVGGLSGQPPTAPATSAGPASPAGAPPLFTAIPTP